MKELRGIGRQEQRGKGAGRRGGRLYKKRKRNRSRLLGKRRKRMTSQVFFIESRYKYVLTMP